MNTLSPDEAKSSDGDSGQPTARTGGAEGIEETPYPPTRKHTVGRLAYFIASALLIGLTLPMFKVSLANDPIVLGSVYLLSYLIQVSLTVLRFRSIGWRGRAAGWMFVPVANTAALLAAYCLPPGYARTKSLDTAAKNMLGIFLALIFVVIIAGVVS